MAGVSSTPAPALPPDDVIREILLRLPPHPACLLRVSLVCKHWRRLVRDPGFLRGVRARHRHRPPLLGFFDRLATFVPAGQPPDRVAAAHFSELEGGRWRVLGCHHGRVLLCTRLTVPLRLQVWDPMTGTRKCFQAPQHPRHATNVVIRGSLICGAGVHGRCSVGEEDCRSGPFRVVYLFPGHEINSMFSAVYYSHTASWGDLVPMTVPKIGSFVGMEPSILLGNAVHWLSCWSQDRSILGFDLDTNQIYHEDLPRDCGIPYDCYQIFKARFGGLLGVAALRGLHIHLFELALNSGGSMTWVEYRSVDLAKLLPPAEPIGSPPPPGETRMGFDEDGNTIFLKLSNGIFQLHLASLKLNKVVQQGVSLSLMIPYRSFYVEGGQGFDNRANDGAGR
ncbi:hypothetical protein EJB05_23010, partial [Eragrostis curvula]